MPELPEVETTCRGIAAHVLGRRFSGAIVRDSRFRWPIPDTLASSLAGKILRAVSRRAKYLLIAAGDETCSHGTLIVHLGMSGSIRHVPADTPAGPHDHVDLLFEGGDCLRLRDPRRFGAVLWTADEPEQHPLLASIGPEPLERNFNEAHLFEKTRRRTRRIRDFLLDSHAVAGIGNIYAAESLFTAAIRPARRAGSLTRDECARLVVAIRAILRRAIRAGGTTLRDFSAVSGRPGYFRQRLSVYGRAGQNCPVCGTRIRSSRSGNRAMFWCPGCQR